MKKIKNILTLIVCVMPALVGVIAHTVVVNTLAIDGKKLKQLENESYQTTQLNEQLEFEIAKLSTIELIEQKANQLGMQPVSVSFVENDPTEIASQ